MRRGRAQRLPPKRCVLAAEGASGGPLFYVVLTPYTGYFLQETEMQHAQSGIDHLRHPQVVRPWPSAWPGTGGVCLDKESAGKYLRIYLDKPQGLSLDDCESYHRAIPAPAGAVRL